MRGGVDAASAAADHRDACAGKLVREFAGGVLPVVGRPSRAHHRDAVSILGQQMALHVQHDRGIIDFPEQLRIFVILLKNEPRSEILDSFQFTGQVGCGLPLSDG